MDSREKASQYFERSQIADQISKARKQEKEKEKDATETYKTHRSGKECLYRIGGLEHYFEYLKQLKSNRVLDIGGGSGNASSVISHMPMSADIDYHISVLRSNPELAQYFPKDKIHITGVETLRGIENQSLAGILGVNSIAYAAYPKIAVKRMDEVLVPGGAAKATFHTFGGVKRYRDSVFKGPEKFIEFFSVRGYDVAFQDHNFVAVENERDKSYFANSILLAIKPGNLKAPSARDLLASDLKGIEQERTGQENGYDIFTIDD